jgi:hypothetical protein
MAQPEVRTRRRIALGQGRINAQIEPFAGANYLGEEPQLPNCARSLALEPGPGQARLGVRPLDQGIADRHYAFSDRLEEACPLLEPCLAIDVEGVPG